MSNWNHYEAFVHVVDAGSFSIAARQMNVSKSLLSRRISELEGDFGTQLLFRTTRRVTPTDAGLVFFERCQHILGQIEDAKREQQAIAALPGGNGSIIRLTHRATGQPELHRIKAAWVDAETRKIWRDDEVANCSYEIIRDAQKEDR